MTRAVQANGRSAKLRIEGKRLVYESEGAEPVEYDFELQATGPGTYWVRMGNRSFQVVRNASGQVEIGRAHV